MVLVDPRRGSGELFEALSRKVHCDMDSQLPAGDFAFEGYIESGRGLIGIERKRIYNDMLKCMTDGRFSGYQLIEMAEYFRHLHLVVEGLYRANKDTGLLEIWGRDRSGATGWMPAQSGSRKFMYADLHHHLMTLALKTPVKIWRTGTPDETVQLIASMYSWYNDKAWDKHTSHLQMHKAPVPGQRVSFRRPSLRRRVACELNSVGWERSQAVEQHFPNTKAMINATAKDWMEIEGIGKGIAEKIVRMVEEE